MGDLEAALQCKMRVPTRVTAGSHLLRVLRAWPCWQLVRLVVSIPLKEQKKKINASYRIRTCAGKAQTITRKFLISKESRNHTFLLVDLLNHSDKLASVKMTKLCLLILCQHRQTQSRFGVLLFEPAFKKSHTPGMHFPLSCLFLAVGQICCLSHQARNPMLIPCALHFSHPVCIVSLFPPS